ncbi:MAG: sulfatase, partial [Pseudomonadota bacterium]
EGGIGSGVIPIRGLSDEHTTLAELLKNEGYGTAGVISCNFLAKSYGLHQGFDYYNDYIPSVASFMNSCAAVSFLNIFLPLDDFLSSTGHNGHKTAQQINASATAWLAQQDLKKPFFLMTHYFDAHHPYFPEKMGMKNVPASIINRYNPCTNYLDLEKQIIDSIISGRKKLLPDEKDFLVGNYDRLIAALDKKLGEFFSQLKKMGLYDDSLIIIVSDHGESFGEHNLMLHGLSLYEDNLRVPLLIKYPLSGQVKGTVDYPVSLAGLAPTVLSYASIPVPDFMQGSPLFEPHSQKILAMLYYSGSTQWSLPEALQGDQFSLLDQGHKLIQFGNGQKQVFDLTGDPEETNNKMNEREAISEKLLADLHHHIKKLTDLTTGGDTNQTIDKGAIQNLKNLGYIK